MGMPSHAFERQSRGTAQPRREQGTTLEICPVCGVFYDPGHGHKCEKLDIPALPHPKIDPKLSQV